MKKRKKYKDLNLIRITDWKTGLPARDVKPLQVKENVKEIVPNDFPVKEIVEEIVPNDLPVKETVKETVPNDFPVEEKFPIEREKQVSESYNRVVGIKKGDSFLKPKTIRRKILYKKIFHEIFADSQKKVLLFFLMSSLTALGVYKQKGYAILLLALTIYLLKPVKLLRLYKEYIQNKKKVLEELENLELSARMYRDENLDDPDEELQHYFKRYLPGLI